jgi:hypothetical protein
VFVVQQLNEKGKSASHWRKATHTASRKIHTILKNYWQRMNDVVVGAEN